MNIFNQLTLKTLRANRMRTLVTVIGMVLSTAMFCAVTTFTTSFQQYMVDIAVAQQGDYYGTTASVTGAKVNEVKNAKEIRQLAVAENIGYARIPEIENEYKPYLYLLGADDTFQKTMPLKLIKGRMPQTPNELLLPAHLQSNGGVKYRLQDTLELDIGQRMLDGNVLNQNNPYVLSEKTGESEEQLQIQKHAAYTVVGFYERPAFEEYEAPGYTAITAFSGSLSNNGVYDIYYKTGDPKDIYAFMEQHDLGVTTNWELLAYNGASRYQGFYGTLYGFAAIVVALIMFGSVSLIYNAFAISVSDRTKQFGLLSSVGATRRQIRHMVLFEAFTVSLIGIPFGIISGIGGIGVTLHFLGDKMAMLSSDKLPMRLSVSWWSVLAAVVISLITVLISAWIPSKRATKVSAIEAIRQSGDISVKPRDVKTRSFTQKCFGFEGMLAQKYYRRSRKKYRATILSLFMSIVLFISASSFCTYLTDSVNGVFGDAAYDILCMANNQNYTADHQGYAALMNQLKKVDGVTASGSHWSLSGVLADSIDKTEEGLDAQLYILDNGSYRSYLEQLKLEPQKYMDPAKPMAIVYDLISKRDNNAGRYVNYHALKDDSADTLSFYGRVALPAEKQTEDRAWDFYDLPAIQIGVKAKTPPFGLEQSGAVIKIIIPQCFADFYITGELAKQQAFSFEGYFNADDHAAVYEKIKAVTDEQDLQLGVIDYAKYDETNRAIIVIIRTFAYGFIVLISFIAIANVFNTISTNISLRRREFAMLKSVGMTAKGFNKMMNFECVLYGLRSLLYGLPVAIGITWLIYRSADAGWQTKFYMPWQPVTIAVISVFAVVFITMMYSMRKIKRENPIDALKNKNL